MIQLSIKAILFCSYCFANVSAAGKNSLSLLSSKVKDAAIAAQSSAVAKMATEADDASNDSHPYLYDLLVDSVTIDGTKVNPASKASKLPSRSPSAPSLIPSIMSQDDDSFTDDNSAFPGANETVATNNTDDSFSIESSLSPSQTSHGQTASINEPTSIPTSNMTTFFPPTSNENATTAVSSAPSPLMSIEDTTTIPTILVSNETAYASPSNDPAQTEVSTVSPALALDECPKQFNKSIEYYEFDVVSLAKRRYECKQWPKDTYCNGEYNLCVIELKVFKARPSTKHSLCFCIAFAPNSELGFHGWTDLGPCTISTEDDGVAMSSTISPSSSAKFAAESDSPVVNSIIVIPTQAPAFSSPENLSVKLPRIICDISLSPSLTERFEEKHILLVSMTNIIFTILDIHLNKALYKVDRISLSVKVSIEENENEAVAPTIRLKADFTGDVSFTGDVTPSEKLLVDILLEHFSIEEYTKRLTSPLKTTRRAAFQDPVVKVNSVFFLFEDGMVLRAGAAYEYVGPSVTPTGETPVNGMQLAVGVFALTAVGFALTMVLAVAHSK